MGSTTIRVDKDTHARLLELSRASGASLVDTVREAAEALRRIRFADQVSGELEELRRHPEAWNSYLAEADMTSVNDGVGK